MPFHQTEKSQAARRPLHPPPKRYRRPPGSSISNRTFFSNHNQAQGLSSINGVLDQSNIRVTRMAWYILVLLYRIQIRGGKIVAAQCLQLDFAGIFFRQIRIPFKIYQRGSCRTIDQIGGLFKWVIIRVVVCTGENNSSEALTTTVPERLLGSNSSKAYRI